jgi:hypothetical protein
MFCAGKNNCDIVSHLRIILRVGIVLQVQHSCFSSHWEFTFETSHFLHLHLSLSLSLLLTPAIVSWHSGFAQTTDEAVGAEKQFISSSPSSMPEGGLTKCVTVPGNGYAGNRGLTKFPAAPPNNASTPPRSTSHVRRRRRRVMLLAVSPATVF